MRLSISWPWEALRAPKGYALRWLGASWLFRSWSWTDLKSRHYSLRVLGLSVTWSRSR